MRPAGASVSARWDRAASKGTKSVMIWGFGRSRLAFGLRGGLCSRCGSRTRRRRVDGDVVRGCDGVRGGGGVRISRAGDGRGVLQ